MTVEQRALAALLQRIGEPVELFYDPRNVGQEWYVGLLAGATGLPLHGHFHDLQEGLRWIADQKQHG